ncbi:membrane protein [Polymorphobacter multimanifer]|uniref:Putative ABC transport system permease protein n=1 Tax=Polymorphobacter multimanifer TaxID=1070431 RepID=A0A841L9D8_9SPHN|nr:ABC transporter permease [Polymorphobacter multimanifer]MBB6229040.1 putative ABC transport system permease protein [Polymorphobacter multimanifer]GGI77131.1 membrane protein [Polymorphobacter multimanifer]
MSIAAFFAPTRIAVRGLGQRWPMALATVLGIALVVLILLGFLAAADGFSRSLEGAGSDKVAIIVSGDARSETASVLAAPDLAILRATLVGAGVGAETISPERVATRTLARPAAEPAGVVVRGVTPSAAALRPQLTIVDGRMMQPGRAEVLLGQAAARRLGGRMVGDTLLIEGRPWRVVGLFSAGGSALESEVWADTGQVAAEGGNVVQSLRVGLDDGLTLEALRQRLAADKRIDVSVSREDRFFAAQSTGVAGMVRRFGWPIAIVMAVGALAGALNTMYSSVAVRGREIATLRAIGFGRAATFAATFAEALVLATAGAAIGIAAGLLLIDGHAASTLGAGAAETSFTFVLTTSAIVAALVFALVTGALGGALPALRASRQPILKGLSADV